MPKNNGDVYEVMFKAGKALETLCGRCIPGMPKGAAVQRVLGQRLLHELYVHYKGIRIIGAGNGLPVEFINDPDFIAYCKDAIRKLQGLGTLTAVLGKEATRL